MKNKSFFKKNRKIIFSLLFLFTLIFITFFFIFRKYDISLLLKTIEQTNKLYIFLAVLMVFVYLSFESLSTRNILKSLNEKTSFLNNFKYACVDYYYCYITPSASGGQPVVGFYMNTDKIKIENMSITLLFNTLQFKLVLLFLAVIALIFSNNFIFNNGTLLIVLFFIGFIINIILVLLCFMGIYSNTLLTKLGFIIINFLYRYKIIKNKEKLQLKLFKKMKDYKQSAYLISTHKTIFLKSFFYNLVQRVAMFSIGFFVYLSFDHSSISYLDLLSIQVIIALSVDTLPLPGGVLVSEALMLRLYHQLYLKDIIVPAMLLTRAISYYFCLLFTFFVIILFHLVKVLKKNKNKIGNESSEN